MANAHRTARNYSVATFAGRLLAAAAATPPLAGPEASHLHLRRCPRRHLKEYLLSHQATPTRVRVMLSPRRTPTKPYHTPHYPTTPPCPAPQHTRAYHTTSTFVYPNTLHHVDPPRPVPIPSPMETYCLRGAAERLFAYHLKAGCIHITCSLVAAAPLTA